MLYYKVLYNKNKNYILHEQTSVRCTDQLGILVFSTCRLFFLRYRLQCWSTFIAALGAGQTCFNIGTKHEYRKAPWKFLILEFLNFLNFQERCCRKSIVRLILISTKYPFKINQHDALTWYSSFNTPKLKLIGDVLSLFACFKRKISRGRENVLAQLKWVRTKQNMSWRIWDYVPSYVVVQSFNDLCLLR